MYVHPIYAGIKVKLCELLQMPWGGEPYRTIPHHMYKVGYSQFQE